jgi:hypothetical protein
MDTFGEHRRVESNRAIGVKHAVTCKQQKSAGWILTKCDNWQEGKVANAYPIRIKTTQQSYNGNVQMDIGGKQHHEILNPVTGV